MNISYVDSIFISMQLLYLVEFQIDILKCKRFDNNFYLIESLSWL